MLNIGCHLSTTKGFYNMGKEALSIGANTFQFFTRNPRGGKAKDIDESDVNKLIKLMEENNFSKILAHAPYTLNACSKDESTREFALEMMTDDLKRMEYIPNNLYNFHPGSHVKQGTEVGIEFVAELLNKVLKKEQTTKVLLETMAGKGTEIGRSFEEIAQIISKVEFNEHIGVCLDTCCAIHLNDSKNPFNSHKDRHEKIGEGSIGLTAITNIINHPKLKDIPFYLETPNELDGYAREIELLRNSYKY